MPRCLTPLPVFVLALVAACAPGREGRSPARPLLVIAGFRAPESVLHDPEQDVYFVSNISGGSSDKDGDGFISRVRPDGTVDSLGFVRGGRDGTTLHAPKGMALVGDTLWVTDIDAIRGFDRRNGLPLATIAVPGSGFLNDLAVGPDGMLYATDSGFREAAGGSGRAAIYRVAPGHRPGRVLADVPAPNGLARTADGRGFLIASFGDDAIREWRPLDGTVTVRGHGPGRHDGLVVLEDGRVVASSWTDSALVTVGPAGPMTLVTGVPSPADVGLDRRRGRFLVPLLQADRVEVWAVPPGP
jgi:sugar lactone lactonase YvrE